MSPLKGMKQESGSLEGHSAKLVAERWGLAYREAHTLSIDPAALEILDRDESRRLRVLPLELGPDGPVFAVAEPSEERFSAVRELAGDNVTFVVVAQETLDALLNSKVFSVPASPRRPSLFRRNDFSSRFEDGETGHGLEGLAPVEPLECESSDGGSEHGSSDHGSSEDGSSEHGSSELGSFVHGHVEEDEPTLEASSSYPEQGETENAVESHHDQHADLVDDAVETEEGGDEHGESGPGEPELSTEEPAEADGGRESEPAAWEHDERDPWAPAVAEAAGEGTAFDDLLTKIQSGAGSLRAQVEHLTASLEATQRELREANEQLAEANRTSEGHDQEVDDLRGELETLREELAAATARNASMTARLEEVARALMQPPSGEAGG